MNSLEELMELRKTIKEIHEDIKNDLNRLKTSIAIDEDKMYLYSMIDGIIDKINS